MAFLFEVVLLVQETIDKLLLIMLHNVWQLLPRPWSSQMWSKEWPLLFFVKTSESTLLKAYPIPNQDGRSLV